MVFQVEGAKSRQSASDYSTHYYNIIYIVVIIIIEDWSDLITPFIGNLSSRIRVHRNVEQTARRPLKLPSIFGRRFGELEVTLRGPLLV